MTGTTTQVMIDLADRFYKRAGESGQSPSRLVRMSTNIVVFASGCGIAALLYARFSVWCFVLPPIVAMLSLIIRLLEPAKTTS